MHPKTNAGDRSEKDHEGGDEPQELVHAVFRDAIILDVRHSLGICRDRMIQMRTAQKMPQGARFGNRGNGRYWQIVLQKSQLDLRSVDAQTTPEMPFFRNA